MTETYLSRLGITPAEVRRYPTKEQTRLVRFLLRWESPKEALLCLEEAEQSGLVSLMDMKAEAYGALRRYNSAIRLMKSRIATKRSNTAEIALARYYLLDGEAEKARETAERITNDSPQMGMGWGFLGEVALHAGDWAAAEAAYLQQQKLAPKNRRLLWGLAQAHAGRGDLVTATAYAVRAYTVEEGSPPPAVRLLRELRDFFQQVGDINRYNEAQAGLNLRLESEFASLASVVAEGPAVGKATSKRKRAGTAVSRLPAKPAPPPLPDLAAIPVDSQERERIATAVQTHFGFDSLRPAQLPIMACALRGEDVLAILPTGAGKSLCYQLPALLDEGVTLIISPLIALMKDQVDSLPPEVRGRALALNSSLDGARLEQAIGEIGVGKYKMVYAAPERLRQRPFVHALREAGVARLVIDEAHCVSTWGHDFRPDYLWVSRAHSDLGAPPVLAMTATAPPLVRQDIERRLFHETGRRFRYIARDTFRNNLRLAAIKAKDADQKMYEVLSLCQRLQGSGIVYARSRRQCEEVALLLRQQGLKAAHYHAGIRNRAQVQERFMRGETDIIVATIAFGMGVDKADIRFIIHFGLPNSMEAYYQEAGRAGRDGVVSHCVLLHSNGDKGFLSRMANNDALEVDFLRQVYAALQKKGGRGETVSVSLERLAGYLETNETAVRVAISALEQTGMLRRDYDAPRTLMLTRTVGLPQADEAFTRFAKMSRLPQGQSVTRNLVDVSTAIGTPLAKAEAQLLAWESAGWVGVVAHGRDALLTILPPPQDASTRIGSWLDQQETLKKQRIADIAGYAKTGYCRHGYLANHLGGQARERCEECDNCVGEALLPLADEAARSDLPEEVEQMRWVLAALDEKSWGKRNLVWLLRGDERLNGRGEGSCALAALNFRSEAALGRLVVRMVRQSFINENRLEHGGVALEVSRKGRQFLQEKGGVPRRKRVAAQEATAVVNQTTSTINPSMPPPPPAFDEDWGK